MEIAFRSLLSKQNFLKDYQNNRFCELPVNRSSPEKQTFLRYTFGGDSDRKNVRRDLV
jgi:hypothetical protein